jgi:hypothetical protein
VLYRSSTTQAQGVHCYRFIKASLELDWTDQFVARATDQGARVRITEGHIGWADWIFLMATKHLQIHKSKYGAFILRQGYFVRANRCPRPYLAQVWCFLKAKGVAHLLHGFLRACMDLFVAIRDSEPCSVLLAWLRSSCSVRANRGPRTLHGLVRRNP